MAFTIGGWYQSVDTSTTITDIDALADQHLTTSGDDIFVPDVVNKLGAVYVVGADLSRARFSTPTLRKRLLMDIEPVDVGTEPANPVAFTSLFNRPVQLTTSEGARLAVINDGSSASAVYGVAFFTDGSYTVPEGEIFTVRTTNTSTLAANAWTLGTLTFSQQLEAGRYALVGMRAHSAGLVAARAVIPGSPWRPGCIGRDAVSDYDVPSFRQGNLGVWGEFSHLFPPQIEFLSGSADSSQVVHLDLIKTA